MMLRLLLLFHLLQMSCGFDLQGSISPDPQSFLQKYALIKLYESCFGRDNMFKMKTQIKAATLKCQQLPQMPIPLDQDENDDDFRAEKIDRNTYLNQYVNSIPAVSSNGGNLPLQPKAAAFQQQQQMLFHPHPYLVQQQQQSLPPHFMFPWRGKRQSSSSTSITSEKEQLDTLKNDILSKLSNVTCILVEMGILNEQKKINVEGLKQEFSEMDIDVVMRVDLQKGVDTCAKFSACLPLEEFSAAPVGREIAPAVMFVNCFRGKKMEACIKKDLRERLMDFSKNEVVPEEVAEMLSRTANSNGVLALPENVEDMETFVFAMLYEDEPKSIL